MNLPAITAAGSVASAEDQIKLHVLFVVAKANLTTSREYDTYLE